MKKHCVLISGPSICGDEELFSNLRKDLMALKNPDNRRIETVIKDIKVDLILFEIANGMSSELEIIKEVKDRYPNIDIIFINGNGDRETIAKAFSYGVKDAFRMPYRLDMLVERVKAILGVEASLDNNLYDTSS